MRLLARIVRRAAAFGCVAVISLHLAGCARSTPAEDARARGVLLMGNGPEPAAIDPHLTTGVSELNIQRALYEGLVVSRADSTSAAPGVAVSWEVDDSGTVWQFNLREDARWSDGSRVVAEDFVAAWMRALDPAIAAPNAWMLNDIKGARSYNRGETTADAVALRAIGEGLLEVELEHPVPWFLQLLKHPVFAPVPHKLAYAEQRTGGGERSGSWARAESFIGNGPFKLKEWRPVQYLEVDTNPHYWNRENIALNGIRFAVFEDPGAEERAFLAGQLHITDSLPPARVAAYQQEGDERLRIDPYLGTYYILLNHRVEVLADPRVRRALDLAINKQAIAERVLGAGQTAAYGFVPDSLPGFESQVTGDYDPDRARSLLAEAGFPGGTGFPVLNYLFNTSESHRRIAEALQAMWADVLGIQIQLENVEWRTYLQRRESGDYQLARAVWIGDYPEPSTFLGLWANGSAVEWSGWSDTDFIQGLQAATSLADESARMRAYASAEAMLMEQLPFLPLYHYVTVYLKNSYVTGWQTNLLDWPDYDRIRFADDAAEPTRPD